jgi:hypothetical protein
MQTNTACWEFLDQLSKLLGSQEGCSVELIVPKYTKM